VPGIRKNKSHEWQRGECRWCGMRDHWAGARAACDGGAARTNTAMGLRAHAKTRAARLLEGVLTPSMHASLYCSYCERHLCIVEAVVIRDRRNEDQVMHVACWSFISSWLNPRKLASGER
jgi:hypothetical protein